MLYVIMWGFLVAYGCFAIDQALKREWYREFFCFLFCNTLYLFVFLKELWRYCNGL